MNLPAVDEEGYLFEPADWSEDIARELARLEDIVLTEDHWDAIRFMRQYHAEHQITPDVRHVLCQSGMQDRRHETPAFLEHRLTVT